MTFHSLPRLTSLRGALALLLGNSLWFAAFAADGSPEPVSVKAVARFGFDRTAISPEDRASLLAEVARMKDVTWQSVTATGYADSIGTAGYNERLSLRRALAVKRYLVGKGLPADMIASHGAGSAQPVAPNDTEAGRAQNRRTEVEFKGVRTGNPN